MKKIFYSKLMVIVFLIISTFFLVSCADDESEEELEVEEEITQTVTEETSRSVNKKRKTPEMTIMLYLNGSDLETEEGSATDDLYEILDSYLSEDINFIVYTGGTYEWQNYNIPFDKNMIYEVKEGKLVKIKSLPQKNMGESETLTEFLNYCHENYPADKTGIIFWDHGGGPIIGFGSDEWYEGDGLTLVELYNALYNSNYEEKFEFIGFDSCLMASLETAYTLKDFANYLIASEETEPGYGWDYYFLDELTPNMNGEEISELVIDYYLNFYDSYIDYVTLSAIDLSKIPEIEQAITDFSETAIVDIQEESNFNIIAKSRSRTKSFDSSGERSTNYDLIDIVDLAKRLETIYPLEAKNLIESIDNAVVYNGVGSGSKGCNGLSVYYPYKAKEDIEDSLYLYQNLEFNDEYFEYIHSFGEILLGETLFTLEPEFISTEETESGDYSIIIPPEELDYIDEIYFTVWMEIEDSVYIMLLQDSDVIIDEKGEVLNEFDGTWATLDGIEPICLYEEIRDYEYVRYTSPAMLNGEDVELIIVFDGENPNGRILGAVPESDYETGMPSKKFIKLNPGDRLALYYYAEQIIFEDEDMEYWDETEFWYVSDEFIIEEEPQVIYTEADEGEYLYNFQIVDIQQNYYDTDYIFVEYS